MSDDEAPKPIPVFPVTVMLAGKPSLRRLSAAPAGGGENFAKRSVMIGFAIFRKGRLRIS